MRRRLPISNIIMEHMLTLEALMSMLSAFEASDPHDTVYAILWMAQDARPIFFGDPQNAYSPGPSPMQSPALPPAYVNISPPNEDSLTDADSSKVHSNLPGVATTSNHLKPAGGVDSRKSINGSKLPAFNVSNKDEQAEVDMDTNGEEQNSDSNNKSIEEANSTRMDACKKANVILAMDHLQIPKASISTRSVATKFTKSFRNKRIKVDYKKSVFDVCRDFLAFIINRSLSLDMICMPWAPDAPSDEPSLPSWIPHLSGKPFGLSINKAYRRVNADPLVGNPGWGRRHYNAAPKTSAAPMLPEVSDRTLRVKGFAFDRIKKKNFPATAGIVPSQWLHAGA